MDIDGHRDRICADPETCGYPGFQSMREVCSPRQNQGVFNKNAEIFAESFQKSQRETQAQDDIPKLEILPHGSIFQWVPRHRMSDLDVSRCTEYTTALGIQAHARRPKVQLFGASGFRVIHPGSVSSA